MYAKVEGHKNLIRDIKTGAVLNTDESVLRKHEAFMNERQKHQSVQDQINTLKTDLSEIKDLLKILLKDRGI